MYAVFEVQVTHLFVLDANEECFYEVCSNHQSCFYTSCADFMVLYRYSQHMIYRVPFCPVGGKILDEEKKSYKH